MRVLHTLTALGHGGAEVWLLNLIEHLRRQGVDIAFVLKAPRLGELRHVATERGAPTFHIPLRPSQVDYVARLAWLLREGRYDILHVHDFIYSALGIAAAKLAGVPSVLTLHHYTFEPQTSMTRRFPVRQLREAYGRLSLMYAIDRCDAVTALSKTVMARMVPDHARNPRCHYLRLSTEIRPALDASEKARVRQEIGVAERAPLIVHAGRFIEQKNHAGLLRVFRKVLSHRADATLVLMGQGPLQASVLASASDLVGAGSVKFLGLRNDVPDVLAAGDLLLFPSLSEGFGLVALEANAAGLPVVGSKIDGLDEAVVDGETAMLFDVADEQGMADAVLELVRDGEHAARLGLAGRARAIRLYSHQSSAGLLTELYKRLLA